jgi:hypothetical protein
MLKKYKLSFKNIHVIIGSLLILGGIAIGIYIGIWVLFIGGAFQIVDAIQTTPIIPKEIVIGITKMFFCGFGGIITFIMCGLGSLIIKTNK